MEMLSARPLVRGESSFERPAERRPPVGCLLRDRREGTQELKNSTCHPSVRVRKNKFI